VTAEGQRSPLGVTCLHGGSLGHSCSLCTQSQEVWLCLALWSADRRLHECFFTVSPEKPKWYVSLGWAERRAGTTYLTFWCGPA
jgi:hypothetical protein